MDHIGVDLKVI